MGRTPPWADEASLTWVRGEANARRLERQGARPRLCSSRRVRERRVERRAVTTKSRGLPVATFRPVVQVVSGRSRAGKGPLDVLTMRRGRLLSEPYGTLPPGYRNVKKDAQFRVGSVRGEAFAVSAN